jgi:hypothetical protein
MAATCRSESPVARVPWEQFADAAVEEHGESARTIVDAIRKGYMLGYEEGVRAAEGGGDGSE